MHLQHTVAPFAKHRQHFVSGAGRGGEGGSLSGFICTKKQLEWTDEGGCPWVTQKKAQRPPPWSWELPILVAYRPRPSPHELSPSLCKQNAKPSSLPEEASQARVRRCLAQVKVIRSSRCASPVNSEPSPAEEQFVERTQGFDPRTERACDQQPCLQRIAAPLTSPGRTLNTLLSFQCLSTSSLDGPSVKLMTCWTCTRAGAGSKLTRHPDSTSLPIHKYLANVGLD